MDALSALHARNQSTRELLRSLVEVNSHTGNVPGVNRVGELLIAALADLPLTLSVAAAPSGAHHLSFATAHAEREPSVLLVGHHDTVFPPGVFEGYSEAGDIARGPGVLDMKSGLAMIVQVLHALHHAGELEARALRFVTVADEEVGSPSGREVLEALVPHCRAALVFEAGRAGDAVITARRGSGNAIVRAHGKAAHAGNNLSDGRNAIWSLAKFVDAVSSAPAIAGAGLNVGLIRGGSARNSVPDQASAELDLRFSDREGQAALFALLEQATQVAIEGTRIELTLSVSREPWARNEASAALARRYGEAALAAGLSFAEAGVIGGGSDANTVGALDLPAIDGLGPRGSGFHTPTEYIELSSLPKKAEALLRLLLAGG
jgi:glutamate carboxypeptidase